MRISEAKALRDSSCFAGAYYLCGYAIECALKACVSKQVRENDFPDKELANKAHTHNLERLLSISGLEPDYVRDIKNNEQLKVNWAIIKDWNEASRYRVDIDKEEAHDLIDACIGDHGILDWIKAKW